MVANRYFAHEGRDGSKPAERIRAAGYLSDGGAWRIGENLAWGTGELASPKAIMAAWMNSPGHRANILMPAYREIGFGVIAGNPSSGDGGADVRDGVRRRRARRALRLAPRPHRHRPPRRLARPPRHARRQAPRRPPPRQGPRMRARRSRARIALSPRSRKGRVVGRVSRTSAGLG